MLVYVMDDEKIQEASFPHSFYFKSKDTNHKKAQKLATRVNTLQNKLTLKVVSENNLLETVKNANAGLITIDNYDLINKYANYFLFAKRDVFVLSHYNSFMKTLFITNDNKEFLIDYFDKKNIINTLNKRGFSYPRISFDFV